MPSGPRGVVQFVASTLARGRRNKTEQECATPPVRFYERSSVQTPWRNTSWRTHLRPEIRHRPIRPWLILPRIYSEDVETGRAFTSKNLGFRSPEQSIMALLDGSLNSSPRANTIRDLRISLRPDEHEVATAAGELRHVGR